LTLADRNRSGKIDSPSPVPVRLRWGPLHRFPPHQLRKRFVQPRPPQTRVHGETPLKPNHFGQSCFFARQAGHRRPGGACPNLRTRSSTRNFGGRPRPRAPERRRRDPSIPKKTNQTFGRHRDRAFLFKKRTSSEVGSFERLPKSAWEAGQTGPHAPEAGRHPIFFGQSIFSGQNIAVWGPVREGVLGGRRGSRLWRPLPSRSLPFRPSHLRQNTLRGDKKRCMAPRGVARTTMRRRVQKTAQKESTAKI
jgi:hypothetical protein